ncbi:uncharacterized protein N7498_002171 [Penicillium cinerascens]|uniref:Uncharacterized protein n=1 Tax=Penicillium cinerascens TaxID=70096 RepID=A0A9W9TAZ1_9EURO|nr:uncharacterized protein N7498_002171 [Penicillium cinerascens]KAJ5215764.1 hypothetical protein N7498_002171 [Penicillium cinerascens]
MDVVLNGAQVLRGLPENLGRDEATAGVWVGESGCMSREALGPMHEMQPLGWTYGDIVANRPPVQGVN